MFDWNVVIENIMYGLKKALDPIANLLKKHCAKSLIYNNLFIIKLSSKIKI